MRIPNNAVVVGYDGSEQATAALEWAAGTAAQDGRTLVVLNAADKIAFAYDSVVGSWTPESAHQAAREVAERGVAHLGDRHPGLPVEVATSLSGAAAALEEASTHASLVVLGNRGRGRIAGTLLGSTAFAISVHARCPVVVVPRGSVEAPGAERPVLVGVDGSDGSTRAVDAAAAVAAAAGAPLHVVTAWRRPDPDPWGIPPPGFPSMRAAVTARQDMATAVAEAAAERVREQAPEVKVETVVTQGRAEEVLADATKRAALLVVGARGRGDLASLLLGSTSRSVLHDAACPVYIVR